MEKNGQQYGAGKGELESHVSDAASIEEKLAAAKEKEEQISQNSSFYQKLTQKEYQESLENDCIRELIK